MTTQSTSPARLPRASKRVAKPAIPQGKASRPGHDPRCAVLWEKYRASRSPDDRHQLLNAHVDLIRSVAAKLSTRLPGCVDMNDLIQDGYFGLDKAIDAFDPGRGVQFSTFACKRIWGSMMDGLRGDDWQRRTDRRRTQRLDQARQQLTAKTGIPPTDDEIADHLKISPEEFAQLWRDARARGSRTLWTGLGGRISGDNDTHETLPMDAAADDPTESAQRADLLELLVKGFTRAERLLVILYYYENMTMKEIGETLAISESRVSQMHSLLVQRIKAALHDKMQEFW